MNLFMNTCFIQVIIKTEYLANFKDKIFFHIQYQYCIKAGDYVLFYCAI